MRVLSRRLFLSTVMVVMTGCGSQQFVTQLWPWKQDPPPVVSDLSQPFPHLPGTASSAGRPDEANTADFDFDRSEVENYVDRFQSDLRNFYGRALERSGRFVSFMEPILRQEGVPPELVYLPLIESGFQTGAVSHAGATGPWQFMRQTGRRYGLRIDNYVDERRDPIKSTEAAARYLRDLYDMFNDWHLSLAAYNTGEGNISRILARRGANDYWDMRNRGYIVRETREYVPRFLAALQIARSPETYGFSRPEDEAPSFDWVRINRPLSLEKVAQICGTSAGEIRELNPALTRGVIPHNGYTVRIPKGMKRTFMEAAAKLPATERYAAKTRGGGRCSGMQADGTYCLRAGETAASVAQRYGISTQALLNANDIRNPRRMTVGQPLVIPGHRSKSSGTTHAAAPRGQTRTAASTHRVRSGETLGAIAARHGMTPAALAHANGMRNANRVRIGQVLQIPGRAGSAAPTTQVATSKPATKIERPRPTTTTTTAKVPAVTDPPRRAAAGTHQVRAGENPAAIAKRYGVPLNDLLRANGVRDPRRIQAGRTLVIPGAGKATAGTTSTASSTARTHKVAAGETIASIAARHGVSSTQLLRANGIRDARRIQIGQILVLPSSKGTSAKAASQPARASTATHTVRSGDTLYSIARRYRVSLDALCAANGIKDKRSIRLGQKLTIPKQLASK